MVILIMQSHHSNASTNDIPWLQMLGFTSFCSLWLNKCNGALGNSIGIPKDMSRQYQNVSIPCVDTSRQCLDMTKYFLDIQGYV